MTTFRYDKRTHELIITTQKEQIRVPAVEVMTLLEELYDWQHDIIVHGRKQPQGEQSNQLQQIE